MNFSTDTQRLKLLFPGTTLSFDFWNKRFEFPGNLPPLNMLILHTRAAFNCCGAPYSIWAECESRSGIG